MALKPFPHPELSMWQSAIDKVVATHTMAAGDKQAEQNWRAQLGAFGTCDPRYAEAAEEYVKYFKLKGDTVPYKRWTQLNDFIIDWPLPPNARIAILGDWGTGQQDAQDLLAAVARKKPDVVIHLGDVYYSGTDFEVNNYFLSIWKSMLDLSTTRTFSLSGNHDMYAGGQAYYRMIADLGQPASYFCLRNANWQFVAMDTGLHDDDAFHATPTYLEDTEVQWLTDKIKTASSRRTVLLSHHQLFTAFDSVGGDACVNPRLSAQNGGLMPD